MGQSQSSNSQKLNEEVAFLEGRTSLTRSEILELHQQYSSKKGISMKEFLENFRKAFPNTIHPNVIAHRVFEAIDKDNDGRISFREMAVAVFIITKAPKEEKLRHMFHVLDQDNSGTLSSQEVIQAVKQSYDILGNLNMDYNRKGINVFRQMDKDGDMRVTKEEFVEACLQDEKLCTLLEGSLGEELFRCKK